MGTERVKTRRQRVLRRSPWHEFDLIAQIRTLAGPVGPGVALGIGDDASAHQPHAGELELVTCDALVEGVHWDWAWCDPESLGHKTAAVNLSDIAAMGGLPERAHLVLALPRTVQLKTVLKLVRGLVDELALHGARLVGGDTNLSPGPMMISLTLQGRVPCAQMLCRRGAQPGDWLMVTGDLGAAAAGLRELQAASRPPRKFSYLGQRLCRPTPRLPEGRLLAKSGRVHALMDLSDGLAGDIRRLCEASRVGAKIFAERLPLAPETRRAADRQKKPAWELALCGGEDYELLFAVNPADATGISRSLEKRLGTACTRVGEVTAAAQGIRLEMPGGKMLPMPGGWEHQGRERR